MSVPPLTAQVPGTQASVKCTTPLVANFQTKTIAGVRFDRPLTEVMRAVGAGNVKRVVEVLENDSTAAWDINLCGHSMRRHWNGLSWSDTVFRTSDGLGVGSLLTALDKRFGRGHFYQSESEGVLYPGFDVDFDGRCYDTLKRNAAMRGPTCLVTGMWLFLSPEVVK
jgi:hypothetical protein